MDTKISFNDISFHNFDSENVKAVFYKGFYFFISKQDLKKISAFNIRDGSLIFSDVSMTTVMKKLNFILNKGFSGLRSIRNKKPSVYVHMNSGIPLFGSGYFGIIDRGTNLIEVKPITGCNSKCIYCSVDEDRRVSEFVVEKDYIVSELKSLITFKSSDDIDVHINSQGEPLLYSPLVELVNDISKIRGVKEITVDTNATLLSRKMVDKLISAGLTRFNVSLNALDKNLAKKIAGGIYDLDKVLDICRYIAKKGDYLLLAPVLIPGVNEKEMEKIVGFSKDIGNAVIVGIQNFLSYRHGRNPVKQIDFREFYDFLELLEKKTGKKLIFSEKDFRIIKAKELEKPFKKGDIVTAAIISMGRMKNEKIAVSMGRCILIPHCSKSGQAKVKITRAKHNIFYGIET